MKKIFYFLFLPIFILFLFAACEKKEIETKETETKEIETKETETTENKITNEKVASFTKKYLDFYDQEDNVFLVLSFEDKDFLEEEVWMAIPQFEIQEAEKTETKAENYSLVIPLKDGYIYGINEVNDAGEINLIFSKALKRGEPLIIKNWGSHYYQTLFAKKENSDEPLYWFNYYMYDDIPLLIDLFCEIDEKEEEVPQNFLSREKKDGRTYINSKVDLNKDGIEEDISFVGQTSEENREMDINEEDSAKFVINDKNFEFYDILSSAGIEEGKLYWNSAILNMEILDIDKKDNYLELVFEVDGNLYESSYGPPIGIFFHYDGDDLKYLGTLYPPLGSTFSASVDSKNSTLKINKLNETLGFSSFQKEIYSIQDGKLQEQENVSDIVHFHKKVIGIAKDSIYIYKEKDSDEILLSTKEGDQLLFISSNFKSWIKVKESNSGKTGYLHFQMKESEYGKRLYFYKQENLKDKSIHAIFDNLFDLY